MTSLNDLMFTLIPMIAIIANVFLLFTLLSAKKDSSVKAFMGLLVAFLLWSVGAFFMRCQMYPGTDFWWKISLTGIFMVPYLYYLLFAAYTEQRGTFFKLLLGMGTLIMVVLNFFNVFMTAPVLTVTDGQSVSDYSVKWPAVFPLALTLMIFICIGKMLFKTVKEQDMPIRYLMPLFAGIFIMLVGICINTIFTSLPTDTLGCALNAICIYYAFYKKRFYALSQITSKGSMYVISILLIGMAVSRFYNIAEGALKGHISDGISVDIRLIVTVLCSALAILLFIGLNKLNEGLFVKDQLRRDDRVHEFSSGINSTLHTDEILIRFADLVQKEIPIEHMYICMYDDDVQAFTSDVKIQSLEMPISLRRDHPLVERLEKTRGGIIYADFQKTAAYKSMWEKEKMQLSATHAAYILPFFGEKQILGFAIFSEKDNHKPYTYEEINFLESVGSVASIALKNAVLYQVLEKEALLDSLTGLLNRRTFNKRIEEQFEKKAAPITLVLFNLDDFSLYNELYGSDEGDRMLIRFGKMLEEVFGSGSIIARYGGKEFAVLLPFCDALTAKELAERVQNVLRDHIARSRESVKKFLTFSAGICSYPTVASNENQLISYANMAVFQVKHHGKNSIKTYDAHMMQQEDDCDGKDYDGKGIEGLTSTIYALTAAIDAKDHYTFNHSQCVSKYATCLAENAGFDADLVEIIRQAGLLHDIGKIGIPDSILTKQGKLSNEEFAIMRQHVERSIEMIRHLPSLDYVIPAVLGHHERFDGKGYPRGISGEDIPISARCLAVADAFDAMVSKRSYKNKMPVEKALEEIERNLGTQFDPDLGRLFINLVRNGTIETIDY